MLVGSGAFCAEAAEHKAAKATAVAAAPKIFELIKSPCGLRPKITNRP
jgi:hypothetical protein